MIQDSGKHTSRFSLLSFETTSNGTEDLISSIGYQDVGPRQEYPARVIPKRYSFNDGRQLADSSWSTLPAVPAFSRTMKVPR